MVSSTGPTSPLDEHPGLIGWMRIVQGILLALLAGAGCFAAVLLIFVHPIGSRTQAASSAGQTAGVVLGGVALLLVLLFAVVLIAMRRRARKRVQQEPSPENTALAGSHPSAAIRRLASAWLVSTVVFVLGLDCAVLLCFVGYIVSDNVALVAMAGAFVVVMVMQMPTRHGLDAWLRKEPALQGTDRFA